MKLTHLLIVLVFGLGLLGCTGNEPRACTMEAKVCPDGSAVGRNVSNNCEFDPCPSFRYCDAATQCARGTCYKFQDLDRSICWQGADPCERCESKKCSILESYPAQIMCGETPPAETSPNTTSPSTTPPEPTPPIDTEDNLTDCSNETLPDDCYYKIATARKDGSFCDNIAAPNKRDACYYVVALQNKDESNCEKISDELLKGQCEHLFTRP
ncbi:MAG: hypothetical protein ABIG39_04135 [Candidatus Micrarchaeota archaeon]